MRSESISAPAPAMKGRTSVSRVRSAAWPLLALSLHVLFAGLLFLVPLPRPAVVSAVAARSESTAPESTIDVVVDEAPPALPALPSEEGTRVAQAPDLTAPAIRSRAAGSFVRAESATDAVAEPVEARESAPAQRPAPAPIAITAPSVADIGIGGRNRFLPTSEAEVEAAESKRAVTNALRDPARQRDQELGLGPEGPVLTALADGTMRSLAPVKGRAVFVATSNAEGFVVSLELADAEGGRPGWADAGRLALAGLSGVKLRIAPGTTRAVMRIEVASTWKLPSGRDPGVDVTLFHVPISKKAEGPTSSKISILDPIPKFKVHYLELGGPGGPKIPLVTVEIDLLDVPVDPVDIGARPRRVIHTHLLDSKQM